MCLNGEKCPHSRGFSLKVVGFVMIDKEYEEIWGEMSHIFKDRMGWPEHMSASIHSKTLARLGNMDKAAGSLSRGQVSPISFPT